MIKDMVFGKVYLVGAGPGDPKLLTVRALEVFKIADVVFYDRLVSRQVLELLPEDVKKVDVGKTPHCNGMSQLDINRLLIQESKDGHTVLRLKGGDPMLFSRGEEEIEAIAAERIEYEIVPGVSSAIGAASYAGIPLTQRGISSSVAIVTGHEDQSKGKATIDFQKLASAVDTIVILMGVAKLQQISEELLGGGAGEETPVAVIESGTWPTQRIQFSTLGNILAGEVKDEIKSPALIIVGEVVRSSKALRASRILEDKENTHKLIEELERIPLTWCAAAEVS